LAVKILGIVALLLFAVACSTTEPPPPPDGDNPQITLELDDATCTEAWLKLTTTNFQLPATLTLKQNDITKDTINLSSADTLLYIDSLLPNTNYTFHTVIQSSSHSSNELSVTTMDTTSHERTWQVFKFGEHGHSVLYDVAIIDENNIWAVGEIYLLDSLGNHDPHAYNALHWDGLNWEMLRIFFPTVCGQASTTPYPAKTILLVDDEVWITSTGDKIAKINDNGQFYRGCVPGSFAIKSIWGNSINGVYIVGVIGNMVSYNGSSWTPMDSGTEVDLLDIFGSEDGTLWTCGYTSDYAITTLLRNAGNGWETVFEGSGDNQSNGYYIGPISGVWASGDKRIYMMNWGGIYIQPNSSELFLEKEIAKLSAVGLGIDGTDDNNIFTCGQGFVGHWNGATYTEYPELYQHFRAFNNVVVKGNTVCAVGSDYNGFTYSEAVIALSK